MFPSFGKAYKENGVRQRSALALKNPSGLSGVENREDAALDNWEL